MPLASKMGFEGLERADESEDYCKERWQILTDHGLTAFGISNHLVGQAICDRIDERHQAILPPDVWGDGIPKE